MMIKKTLLFAFGVFAMIAISACSSEEPETLVTNNPNNKDVKGTLSKSERPTSWTIVAGTTYASMCIIVDDGGIPASIDAQDMLAGFINGECRGIASPVYDASQMYWRFNLAVNSTEADEKTSLLEVEIRYYSLNNGGIYTAKTIPYAEGAPLGVYGKGNGYKPAWK